MTTGNAGAVPPPGHADVWLVALELEADPAPEVVAGLGRRELERAAAFRRQVDARRYVAGRAALRWILAAYAGAEPSALEFDLRCEHCGAEHGKPRLRSPAAPLEFSTSRSAALAAVAIARRPVGVDVEAETDRGLGDLRDAILAPDEADELEAAPAPQRELLLLRCWTRKEALLKACGRGLAIDPREVSVNVLPGESPRVRVAPRLHPDAVSWLLVDLDVPVGYAGALAAVEPNVRVATRFVAAADAALRSLGSALEDAFPPAQP